MSYQELMTGDQPPAKKPKFGPPIMMHASEEQYNSFLSKEVSNELATRAHELAMRTSQNAHELAIRECQFEHELVTRKTKSIHAEMQTEVQVVLAMKEAFESIRPLGDTEKIELCDKMTDIQYRAFRKMGGTSSGSGAAIAPVENILTVTTATAVADVNHVHVDPGHGVPTPDCHASVRGDEISIAQISGFMGIGLGNLAGQVGKRMKALYIAQYGAVAGNNIPKRTTRFNGKPFSEKCFFNRDRGMMEQAIRDAARG